MTLEQRDLFEVIGWLRQQQLAPGAEISALGRSLYIFLIESYSPRPIWGGRAYLSPIYGFSPYLYTAGTV